LLNDGYTSEVREFLLKMNLNKENNQQRVDWLMEEFALLQSPIELSDMPKVQHQVYDMMFLLFEIAAANNLDLDSDWLAGMKRKYQKYSLFFTILN
jgi:BarA-like signal transduction histidine kinase